MVLRGVQRFLSSKQVGRVALLAACLLCAPSLGLGLIADDLPHRKFLLAQIEGTATSAWWDMFDVCGRPGPLDVPLRVFAGALPWWASPELSIAFWRPLSVATHYLDYLLWPQAPWLMHLQNVLWYALVVLLAAKLYERVLGSGAAAGLATLLYAIDEAHIDGASWVAGRNTVVTAAFALLALLAFDFARRGVAKDHPNDRTFRGATHKCASWARLVHPVAMLAALASSEGSLGVLGYLVAYALLLDSAPLWQRLRALAPALLLSGAWFVAASLQGYGVRGSGLYVDPRSDPLAFLAITVRRFPDVLQAQFGLPVELVRALPEPWQRVCWLFGAALLALMAAVAVPRVLRSAAGRFFLAGMLLSALPICAGGAEPRLLFLVGLGGHALVSQCVLTSVAELGSTRVRRAVRSALVVVLLFLHVPVALAGAPFSFVMWSAFDAKLRAATDSLPQGSRSGQSVILVLNTNDYLVQMFVDMYRLHRAAKGPAFMHVLGASRTPVRLSRPERNTLALEPKGGYLLEPTSQLVRSPRERFTPGQVVLLWGVGVRIEAVTSDGRPARVRFELADAEGPHALWVTWDARTDRFERVALPPVGQSRWL